MALVDHRGVVHWPHHLDPDAVLELLVHAHLDGGQLTRIIAGTAGGRRISVPPRGTRPTADRVREALFSMLDTHMDFDGLTVLDLYAGSGALGLEALSRGASAATFVESDPLAVTAIRRNVEALGLAGATVLPRAADAVLRAGAEAAFDLVLADPPYDVDASDVNDVLAALARGGWTRPGTVVMVERRVSSAALTWPPGWRAWRPRRYGDTRLELAEVT